MNKKGFTLVEVLVVIAILGALIVLLIPTLGGYGKQAKEKVLKTKITSIELAAAQWAQTNYVDIVWTKTTCDIIDKDKSPNPITIDCEKTSVVVSKLIEMGYLKADKDGKIYDPVSGEVMNANITVNKYYGSYYANYEK